MVTKALYSTSRKKVFLETSDNLIIPVSVKDFKKDYPTATRKKLLKADLKRQIMMQRKNRNAGITSVAKRQDVIIKKIRQLMK